MTDEKRRRERRSGVYVSVVCCLLFAVWLRPQIRFLFLSGVVFVARRGQARTGPCRESGTDGVTGWHGENG